MPDISMCANNKCPRRNACYRFRAEPNPHQQTYAAFEPDAEGNCEFYWKIEAEEKAAIKR